MHVLVFAVERRDGGERPHGVEIADRELAPAVLRRLAISATPVLPSANLSSLGTRDEVYFVAQYRPCALAVYA